MRDCPLSSKQIEIVQLLADGKTQTDIAEITGRARNTIHRYVCRCYEAAGAYNMHGLVAMAIRKGWIA